MKLKLLISLPALIITGVLSVIGINQAVTSIPTPHIYKDVVYSYSKPLRQESVTISPIISAQPASAPQIASTQVIDTIPTNEDLKAQYGWTTNPYSDSINMLIEHYPQFFTDELRSASFEYVYRASPSVEEGGITYFRTIMSSRWFKVQAWIDEGTRHGLDTSLYQ